METKISQTRSDYLKARYQANKEAILTRNKAWRAANPEKIKEANAKHYLKRKEKEDGCDALRKAQAASEEARLLYKSNPTPEAREVWTKSYEEHARLLLGSV